MSASSPSPFTILVPLDGSELAETVLGLAATTARRTKGHLLLISVPQVYGLDVTWYAAGAPDAAALVPMEDMLRQSRDTSEAYLATTVKRLEGQGIAVESALIDETPANAIVDTARDRGADLIAMVTHGRGGLDRWAFGSVADKVLQTAEVPVLLVRGAHQPVQDDVSRVLVALDGSPLAEAILPTVTTLARGYGARVLLLHITPELGVLEDAARLTAAQAAYQERMSHYLGEVVDRLAQAGVDAEGQLLVAADPAEALLERAEYRDVDLVALTTHGRSGLVRLAYGNVADRILRHTTKPVLVARNR